MAVSSGRGRVGSGWGFTATRTTHVVNLTSSVHELCSLVSRRSERLSLLNKRSNKNSLDPKLRG